MYQLLKFSILVLVSSIVMFVQANQSQQTDQPPHIIVILADDMGWNDVSFHGSNQIPTPNIDALAYNGVILNNHYVQPLCTPSRAAFMTGKYPIHMGMQHSVLLEPEPRGLPLKEKLLPQYLKDIGYSTHLVGKWHLGFYRSEYTPTRRGFDSHYGYWNGLKDYYDHTVQATFLPDMIGYDLRRNMEVDWSARGKYSTYLFADEAAKLINKHNASIPMFLYLAHLAPHTGNQKNPFQAPDEEIAKFGYIADPERRIYAAMMSCLDKSVGTVITALRAKGMLDNSIIVFMSDNGAPTYGIHSNRGSNYPLRGQKSTPWQGGTRGVAAVWSPLLKTSNRVSNHLMHITDWLPTFWKAAGRDPKELGKIDGEDLWETLTDDTPSPRTNILVDADDIDKHVAVRNGDWKYINGTTGSYKYWYGETGLDDMSPEYDVTSVLTSPTGAALSGYITEQQIKEMKKDNKTKVFDSHKREFSFKLLNGEQIVNLRKKAKLECNVSNSNTTETACDPNKEPCLFNILNDPCEYINVANENPVILKDMQIMAESFLKTLVPASNLPSDPLADPALHGDVWTCWKDDIPSVRSIFASFSPSAIAAFSAFLFALFIGLFVLMYYVVKKSHWYKNTIRSKSFTRRRKHSPRNFSDSVDYSKNREPIVVSPITVAQRVEMFEERENSI